jgi:endonuclease/exonuclease/phosphatase family metal-dependent hydrolase
MADLRVTLAMPRFRLVTFNIAHGRGLNPLQGLVTQSKMRTNLRRIARLLEKLKPDIVALQEIDERSRWAGNFDHLDYLRVHTRFAHSVFGINNRRTGLLNLSYGNAVLSHHSIRSSETVVFGQRRMGEKGFLYVELDVGGRCVPLVNLHLHHSSKVQRLKQLDLLTAWLREKHTLHGKTWAMPPIVCGDFNNAHLRVDATASLLRHLAPYGTYTLHPQNGRTFPSLLPARTLDYIFLPPACAVVRCEIIRTIASDHLPVMVEFDVK